MLFDHINNLRSEPFKKWQFNTRSGISTAAFGVTESARYFLPLIPDVPFLYVAKDALAAAKARDEIAYLSGKNVVYLPAKDDVLLYTKFLNRDNLFKRISAFAEISRGAFGVVTTLEALMQPMPLALPTAEFYSAREYSLGTVVSTLTKMGYRRKDFAESRGDFALRGDILEIFPIDSETAFRCDFFGDELERIRTIDEDMRAGDEVRSFKCLPTVDFFIEKDEVDYLRSRLIESNKKFKTSSARVKSTAICKELCDILDRNDLTAAPLAFLIPLLKNVTNDIMKIFPSCKAVFYDEPKPVSDVADGVYREHISRFTSLFEAGEAFDFSFDNLVSYEKVTGCFSVPCHSMQNVNSTCRIFSPMDTVRINSMPAPRYQRAPTELAVDVANWKKSGYRSIIACGSPQRSNNIADLIYSAGEEVVTGNAVTDDVKIFSTDYYFSEGFVLHDEKLALIGALDVFSSGVKDKDKRIKKRRNENFSAPETGDFAVHETYGIGIVRGTERITTTEGSKDYVALEYAGGDFMYIPTDQMDKLTKYLGGEQSPMLSKLGGGEFERIKERVRASISAMSVNLKKLYKDRATKKGFAFSPDNELSEEFDNEFEFELTEDQIQSIAEIKRDMESDKIMDRLLLGDVGFGKTEVALRACFKACLDGKQVAIVAPTTILTEQHYRTIKDRFKSFGVRSCVLNRFQSYKKIKENLKQIAEGNMDIVVGTHRLFGKDVAFKDLGLLILDEEQCFGVEHKEKLRIMKNNVDTLTMSATPIPRTLHMSLSGIRDISLILTPPLKRIPVQSYVTEESNTLIRDAVIKELARGGQVFILYNHVDSIYTFSAEMRELIPEAKIVVGHGQMNRDELDGQIMSFFSGEYNVLIATTIIENGIDIPNANTLIVIDADMLGLFTLYQLKGRVGRSDRVAHAYFTYKPGKILTDSAYKRLSALMEYNELGSGYKIAMRDLEIRGAGNVLGREQHGHMDKIGYELYARLLKEQLGEVTKDFETELDVRLDAYIPDGYVTSSSQRLDMYKAIAEIKDADDERRVRESIADLYGPIPKNVENLILIAELKRMAKKLEVIKLTVRNGESKVYIKDVNSFKDGRLTTALNRFKSKAVLSFDVNPLITLRADGDAKEQALLLRGFMRFALSCPAETDDARL